MFKKDLYVILSLLLATVLFSCKKEVKDASWDVDVLAPLMNTTLTIDNLVTDSLLNKNADSSIYIVYEQELYSMSLDTLMRIDDTIYSYSAKLKSIDLGTREVSYPITLGELARREGTIVGLLILASHGKNAVIPALTNLSSEGIDIDANEFFETVTLDSGFMDIKFKNGLPIDMTNFIYKMSNKNNGTIIAQDTIDLIPAGDSATRTYSLAGKTVDGDIVGDIINIDSPGSDGDSVLVDTTDALIVTIVVRDLVPTSATAIFSAQDLITNEEEMSLKVSGVELNSVRVKSGSIKIEAYNTINDTMHLRYNIPGAKKGGIPFSVNCKLLPGSHSSASHYNQLYDFSGYTLDMTGKDKNDVNKLFQTLVCSIDSTGEVRTLTLNDSIIINYGLIDVIPEYAKGYLGNQEANIGPETSENTIFNKIVSGTIDIEQVSMSLSIENSIGADATVVFKSISSLNSRTNTNVSLTGNIINKHININRAVNNQITAIPNYYSFTLDKNNSNITSLINNLPDKFGYSIYAEINPMGNVSGGNDFIYNTSSIKTNLNFQMPLSLIANNLTFVDTVDFNILNEDNSGVNSGILTLFVDNGFPLEAGIKLYMADETGSVFDSLLYNGLASSATVDGSNKVVQKRLSKIAIPVNESKMSKLYDTKKLIVYVSFTTKPNNTMVKIYSSYAIDFKLTGDFNYSINSN